MNWISVKDRLPSYETLVLVAWRGSHEGAWLDKWANISEAYLHKNGYFDKFNSYSLPWGGNEIAHWQPLPEPPTQ
ncbi:MAG: DUF551 domain-containing protein [Defluviitaleaceae bacterium]|nr:DUF551 domain-containing protein [Defluviitaleaceae bacterium]MCL2261663.1 DUF551 domain-containing protein [Defluviitaleaceae bacterium]